MLAVMLMLLVQQGDSDLSAGRCRAAADRFTLVIPRVREILTDDAELARSGGKAEYTDQVRQTLFTLVENDAAAAKKVQDLYPSSSATSENIADVSALKGSLLAELVRKCAANPLD